MPIFGSGEGAARKFAGMLNIMPTAAMTIVPLNIVFISIDNFPRDLVSDSTLPAEKQKLIEPPLERLVPLIARTLPVCRARAVAAQTRERPSIPEPRGILPRVSSAKDDKAKARPDCVESDLPWHAVHDDSRDSQADGPARPNHLRRQASRTQT